MQRVCILCRNLTFINTCTQLMWWVNFKVGRIACYPSHFKIHPSHPINMSHSWVMVGEGLKPYSRCSLFPCQNPILLMYISPSMLGYIWHEIYTLMRFVVSTWISLFRMAKYEIFSWLKMQCLFVKVAKGVVIGWDHYHCCCFCLLTFISTSAPPFFDNFSPITRNMK